MVDDERQAPAPSAFAWLIDLTAVGGPRFVVVRRDENEAREALVAHLVKIGSAATRSRRSGWWAPPRSIPWR
jgi:hypothetical protein